MDNSALLISQPAEPIAPMPGVDVQDPNQRNSTASAPTTERASDASGRRAKRAGPTIRSASRRSKRGGRSERTGGAKQGVGGDASALQKPAAPMDLRVAPPVERLSEQQEQLRSGAVAEVQAVQSTLASATTQLDQSLVEVAASLALLAVRVGGDVSLLAAIFGTFSNRPLEEKEKADPMLPLALLLLAGKRHKHRRTPVRAAARAVLAHMRERGWSDERISTDPTAKAVMTEWIKEQGGITGLHGEQRARATGRDDAPLPVSLTVSGAASQALRDRLVANQAGLVLVSRDATGRLRTVVQDAGTVEVLPPEGLTAAKAGRDYGGEVVADGQGGQLVRVPASTKVLTALAEGRLRLPTGAEASAAPRRSRRAAGAPVEPQS